MVDQGDEGGRRDRPRSNLGSGSVHRQNREDESMEGRIGRRLRRPELNAVLNCARRRPPGCRCNNGGGCCRHRLSQNDGNGDREPEDARRATRLERRAGKRFPAGPLAAMPNAGYEDAIRTAPRKRASTCPDPRRKNRQAPVAL